MAKSDPILSVEDEVLANLRRQPLGRAESPVGTVADLNLPLEFLRRVADRVIQVSFRERHRIVVGGPGVVEHRPPPAPAVEAAPDWVTVLPARSGRAEHWEEFRPGVREFLTPLLNGVPSATSASFEALAENGVHPVGTMRVQLTGPGYYAGAGDGGSFDILRQLLMQCPGLHVFASIEGRFLADAVSLIASWRPAAGARLMLIPEALPVSQWAQDNAKAGYGPGGTEGAMLLVPRWAGRGEDGGIFIPGETLLVEGLAAAGLRCSRSPLLFEGGNAMVVQEPGGRRVLLLGEADVHRNVARGLAREEVLERFRREFGVQAIVVLPAASFHIDLEVTVRTRDNRVIAFVPDSLRAMRSICRLGAERLAARGVMSAADGGACVEAAEKGRLAVLLEKLGGAIGSRAVGPGQFPLEFAMLFKEGEMDSGVGNLQRVLFALDWIAAEVTPPNRFPADRHAAAYLRSLRRAEADRRALQRQLRGLGWEVVPVPAVSSEEVSLNAINGVHDQRRYFMPAYGGFFEPLDREAAGVFAATLGPSVEIVPMLTGETQRRGGGLHCAVCAIAGSDHAARQ